MAVLPPSRDAHQQIPLQAPPLSAPPALCAVRLWRALQPPHRGLPTRLVRRRALRGCRAALRPTGRPLLLALDMQDRR